MTSYGDERNPPPATDRQAWPAKPTQTRPAATPPAQGWAAPDDPGAALDLPTDVHARVDPPAPPTSQQPPASPWSPPPEPATPPAPQAAPRPAPRPAPRAAPPEATPPTEPSAGPTRPRRGLLLLVAGLVCVLLIGTFVIVVLTRSNGGAASAGTTTGTGTTADPGATADPSAMANAEQPMAADSTSPSPSPSGTRPKPSPSAAAGSAAPPAPARDDFTAATLDRSRWSVYGTNGPGSYSPDMVRVSGGELQVLGAGRNPTAAENKSGGLCWCVNGNHRYGTWQVRAAFDAGSGYRQVLALWPQSDNGTADGSISFASDGDAAKKSLGVVLFPPGGGTAGRGSLTGSFTTWHVYRVDWRATYVRMYVDDALIYDSSAGASPLTIPHTPMHLVIQQDKGPGSGIPAANAQTPDLVVMHVDWVRFDP